MDTFDLYKDISTRTNGDIYFGVVGPVRTGKSTFIKKFMEVLVLPKIEDKNKKTRTVDELPQSAEGKTIMTTQPKFVPNESVRIKVGDNVELNVRLIDCVGYMVQGALGALENDLPRMVKTPWQDAPMPFEQAAEVGTTKVIREHSTIGIVMTTDGSITDIPRHSYIEGEEKAINELKALGKPFIIIINSASPESEQTLKLKSALMEKYGVQVLALDVLNLSEKDVLSIVEEVLMEFPIDKLLIDLPQWIKALDMDNEILQEIIGNLYSCSKKIAKMSQISDMLNCFEGSEFVESFQPTLIDMGKGEVVFEITVNEALFYKALSKLAGAEIADDLSLMQYVTGLAMASKEYAKLKDALYDAREQGYGVVEPTFDEMVLEEPEIVRQQGRVGVRLKASAPSLHILRVDVKTEVNPIVNSEQQGEELVKYLMSEFETNKLGIWQTNIFGKSLSELVREGLSNKLHTIQKDAQLKLRKTMTKMVNEGKGGMICILL